MNEKDQRLTVAQAAELLGTGPRFPRRLIAERRIRFVHVGRHVRIPQSALIEYVIANTVKPLPRRRDQVAGWRAAAASATSGGCRRAAGMRRIPAPTGGGTMRRTP